MFSTLSVLMLSCAMSPEFGLPLARYATGDEMVYTGEVNEESSRLDLPYKRKHLLEVRVFVLSASTEFADLAVLTSLQVKEDPNVASAAATVTGQVSRASRSPTVRLELVRIGAKGKLSSLHPKLPFVLSDKTETKAIGVVPLNVPNPSELGFYLPRPDQPTTSRSTWKTQEQTRPDITWTVRETTMRQGAQVIEIAGEQQSEKWNNPTGTDDAWRRTENLLVATSDGLVRQFSRILERKEGINVVERRTVNCELSTPPSPHRGEGYTAIRKEIEAAYTFEVEWESGRATRLVERIDAFTQRHRETPYRAAIEGVRRRAK